MPDAIIEQEPKPAQRATRGLLHKFLPLPIMDHHARWFDAGPITFGIEGRVIQEGDRPVSERSASIHVFNPDRTEEYLRFDCFADFPHYHYILNRPQHNIVWGYDDAANGPMLPWALAAIQHRLPEMLRRADEADLATRVQHAGVDTGAIKLIEAAIAEWQPQPAADMLEETRRWYTRWKAIHPQFNTAG